MKPPGLYIYKEDWAIINEYFGRVAGRSTLTKTKALREVIHSWTQNKLVPELARLREDENAVAAAASQHLDLQT
jgi:hypothetical protein